MNKKRCFWCEGDPLYISYHDQEWGSPVHDDRLLFEFLVLEGMQAGLSWLTVLKKRENFRVAFAGFDPKKVALFSQTDLDSLLQNPGIIRHRGKLQAAIANAKAFLKIQSEYGSFDRYIWGFVDGVPVQNSWDHEKEVPCSSPVSDRMAKELKQRGFNFVGTKICYAFMQATGLVNDHPRHCFRHTQIIQNLTHARD